LGTGIARISTGQKIHMKLITGQLTANRGRKNRQLLHGGMSGVGKRRGVMGDQQPALFAQDKYIRGLHHGVVKAVGKGGGDVLGASYPADITFNSYPYGT